MKTGNETNGRRLTRAAFIRNTLKAAVTLGVCATVSKLAAAPQTLFVSVPNPTQGLALNAKLYIPDGPGPFPAVVVMHGVGGLWSNDDVASGNMVTHFNEWAQIFQDQGYVALFVDSYTPRGLVEFRSKRPAQNPAIEDSACSPAYVRPCDAYSALNYLCSMPQFVNGSRVAVMGFSHGAETALSTMVSPTITKSPWKVSYLNANGTVNNNYAVSSPFLPPVQGGFVAAVAYYPGCGFYNYFGSSSSTMGNNYMPYAPTLMFHGTEDPLYKDNLYPEKFLQKSASQAVVDGIANPLALVKFTGATHSFDETAMPAAWDPATATPNQLAKKAAREQVLLFLSAHLNN